MKTENIESRCVIGPENILFVGASVHLSARMFYRVWQAKPITRCLHCPSLSQNLQFCVLYQTAHLHHRATFELSTEILLSYPQRYI